MGRKKKAISLARREKVEKVGLQVRRMGAQSVINSKVIAARFGLNPVELEALDLIFVRGQATAGELAKATGLTTGAVTALIDRLEAAGFVERFPSRDDRRMVIVRVIPRAVKDIKAFYDGMQAKMFALWAEYSEIELEVIADFLERSADLSVEYVGHKSAAQSERGNKVASSRGRISNEAPDG
jgi:DNA-binding MarR family transcriptional regulator